MSLKFDVANPIDKRSSLDLEWLVAEQAISQYPRNNDNPVQWRMCEVCAARPQMQG